MDNFRSIVGGTGARFASDICSWRRRKRKAFKNKCQGSVQEIPEAKQQGFRKTKIGLLFALIAFLLCGCVKKIYLPMDAAHYKSELERCQSYHMACEQELDRCKDLGIDLMSASRQDK